MPYGTLLKSKMIPSQALLEPSRTLSDLITPGHPGMSRMSQESPALQRQASHLVLRFSKDIYTGVSENRGPQYSTLNFK